MKLGIQPERITPGRPQQNGRHERMHRTLREEVSVVGPHGRNLRTQQSELERFRAEYNEVRPHEALGQVPPSELYVASARAYPEKIKGPEYDAGMEVRPVCERGQFRLGGQRYFLSKMFSGEKLGFRKVEEGVWSVWFYATELGRFEERTGKMKPVEMPCCGQPGENDEAVFPRLSTALGKPGKKPPAFPHSHRLDDGYLEIDK
jgi:hypothetical protein